MLSAFPIFIRNKENRNYTKINNFKIFRDDPNWQTKQARRKFEKEDLINKNPSFDPIFMKV